MSARRRWQRELRERFLSDLDLIRKKLARVDLAGGEALEDLGDELATLTEEVTTMRCHVCGCSDSEPCANGCGWLHTDVPTCSACV